IHFYSHLWRHRLWYHRGLHLIFRKFYVNSSWVLRHSLVDFGDFYVVLLVILGTYIRNVELAAGVIFWS
ncbi:32155_t:CDS:2, partial [Gigaspora margarita]